VKAYRGEGAPTEDATHPLDCPECGLWFADFAELAAHVTRAHPSSSRADAAAAVTHHFTLQSEERERDDMKVPTSTRSTPRTARTSSSTAIPRADRETQRDDFNAFLKAEHIGRTGKTADLVLTGNARSSDSQFGQQIIAEIKYRGNLFDWAIKLNSPNHRLLEDLVGTETTKWRGKKVAITVRENLGRDYIAIDRPEMAKVNGKTKTTRTTKRRRT